MDAYHPWTLAQFPGDAAREQLPAAWSPVCPRCVTSDPSSVPAHFNSTTPNRLTAHLQDLPVKLTPQE